MKKTVLTLIITAMSSIIGAYAANPEVEWKNFRHELAGKRTKYVQRFTLSNHEDVKRLCFNEFARPMRAINPADTLVEIVPGYYYIDSERFGGKDPIDIDIEVTGYFETMAYLPGGFHAIDSAGKTVPVKFSHGPLFGSPELRNVPGRDRHVYGDSVFRRNEELAFSGKAGVFDIVPSFKSVKITKGAFKSGLPVEEKIIKADKPEFYRITLTPKGAVIEAADKATLRMARRTLERQLLKPNHGEIPCAVIEDYPDFPYRGMMIDVARNFIRPAELYNLVELMADYRFSRLHFHPTDDEAWRLEIPGLPELTEYGSRRGYTLDGKDFLPQIFAGDGNPETQEGTANGYYSKQDFIHLLRLCDSLGIKVITEIESPGHGRAAIKAMEYRERKTGDGSYLMSEKNDTSYYVSAQAFHDNIMNPALPGTYKFINKVVDEIRGMYDEAGVPFIGIHLGGDEVPRKAWDGSPAVSHLSDSLGISGTHAVQGYYSRRIAGDMKKKDIPLYGWEELGVGYDDKFNAEVAPAVGGVNCWHNVRPVDRNVARRAIAGGYPVILSNVDYFYVDQIYTFHPEENGLYWGGQVDEFKTLKGYSDILCPPLDGAKGKVIGVQGQLFGETIRNYPQVQTYLFPKMLGIAERGWNSKPTYTDPEYNRLLATKILPGLVEDGVAIHLRAPGIIVREGKVLMNTPFAGGVVRYTLDGSEPTAQSAEYKGEFSLPEEVDEIRARWYNLGTESVTTLLYIK